MATVSDYNTQQIEAIRMVRQHLRGLPLAQIRWLRNRIRSYMKFRADVAHFQGKHFADICSQKCFTSQTSACCGREGIITFFADVVINILLSTDKEIDKLLQAIQRDTGGFNCVYLNESGCLWRVKPIVCEMFLCEHAKQNVLDGNNNLGQQWETLRRRERRYTWPNRPILFDDLEALFIEAGFDSPLMYLHRSPGLLRLKARHCLRTEKST
ncbi:MAG: hypothetical protein PVG64_06060 [Syntrophobacterales bacterium]